MGTALGKGGPVASKGEGAPASQDQAAAFNNLAVKSGIAIGTVATANGPLVVFDEDQLGGAINQNKEILMHAENDRDDNFISFFFNSFSLYMMGLCIVYGLLHFAVFCVYINWISNQVYALDNPLYVKTVIYYYVATYAVGVLAMLFVL